MAKSPMRRSSTSPGPKNRPPKQSLNPSSLPTKLPRLKQHQKPKPQSKSSKRPGKRLLSFDRRLGARFVAGVLLDYAELRDHRVRPLALLNDSKQLGAARREELFCAILGCAERIAVRVISHERIAREGLHRSNLWGLRDVLHELSPPAEVCVVDGFRLGPLAPRHTAVVDGDERSAAIAAASVIAKVTRDRLMRRLDPLFPHYGFRSHVGYITPGHSAVVRERGPCQIHRRSFQALCYLPQDEALARIDAA